jgi:dihydroorotate dehydrogenase
VIGVGGIERTAQVREMLEAGADLVQIYTGFIYEGPLLPTRIARELGGALEREGIHRVTSLGAAGETALGAPGLSH